MYTKQFEIRWSDIDANMHLGNSSYIDFMSHTRMSFFTDQDLGLDKMISYGLGPVVFYEHIHFFKEVRLDDHITVSLEISGHSKDGRFIKIEHNFYNSKGQNMAFSEMLFSWIDSKTRTLGVVPNELLRQIEAFPRSANFQFLSKEDTRKYGRKPTDISPESLTK
ncbi:MAG: thioesterase family protein [Flavobacteriaceae bacterium]|nr:thioesterase family protein [Flavobacteriaceae bacterium]